MIPASPRILIAPLTGIRALAAFWVVTRHFRVDIIEAFPPLHVFSPLFNLGYLGVDLFFILSGFILTFTHLDSMTEKYDWRKALGFLWLRIGRVWPLTAFVLMLFGLYFVVQTVTSSNPVYAAQADPWRLVQHLLMVQAWSATPLDWNGPDWSISAEWMAYLSFAVGVVVLGRFAAVASTRTKIVVIGLLCLPMIIVGFTMQDDTILLFNKDSYTIFAGVVPIRVLTEFWIGAVLAVLLKNRIREGRTLAFPLPTITSVAIVAVLYLVTAFDPVRWVRAGQVEFVNGVDQIAPTESIIVLPLFVLLIASLAVTRRDPVVWLLSRRPVVLGGKVSFALYLSHPLTLGAGILVLGRFAPGSPLYGAVVIGTLVAAWVFAWVLWRFVEEPSRKLARKMLPESIKV